MSRILDESDTNDFDGIAIGDEPWFQHTTASSKMFARSAPDVLPRMQQAVGAKTTMITVFFTAKELIVLGVLPRGSIFNQLYFINRIFPDVTTTNLIFRRQKTAITFWVQTDNSICHNGSNVTSKMKKNPISECRACSVHQI
jgi:hypothetical protein